MNSELEILRNFDCSIIEEESNISLGKVNITLRLKNKISKEDLIKIAMALKNSRPEYDKLWIFYLLPDMEQGSGAWATTHFSPDLEVEIIGATLEDDEKMSRFDDIEGEVISAWKNEQSLMGAILILHKLNGKFIMTTNFKDGQSMQEELRKSEDRGLVRYDYDNGHGEYYCIEENGNLGLYEKDGNFYDEYILK